MQTFTHDALFAKSKIYISRSLAFRDTGDFEQCQLWASFSLELLGKAALASIHPALVASPDCTKSLFAACGRPFAADLKSIPAHTLWSRLRHVSPAFDTKAEAFCSELARRRNAEVHSGESPFTGMSLDSWWKEFCKTCKTLLTAQSRTVEEWIGPAEAAAVEEVIAARLAAIAHAVRVRIERCRSVFDERYPPGSPLRTAILADKSRNWVWPDAAPADTDMTQSQNCPACEQLSVLACKRMHEELIPSAPDEEEAEEDEWVSHVNVIYQALEFHCGVCGLVLRGRDELTAAGIDVDIESEEELEVEFSEEYGNE